jgi:soluble lytic murein transglycosylase-like protein
LFSSSSQGITAEYIDEAFRTVAEEEGVSEPLLRAICWVESNHKPYAFRSDDAALNNHAFGMCQILYSTAKSLGFKDERCEKNFNEHLPRERNYSSCKLFGPKTNIRYAAKFLKQRLKKYDYNEYKATLAYNSGSYVVCRDGWLYVSRVRDDGTYGRDKFKRCLAGGPINLYYAYRVLNALEEEK